MQDFPLHHWKNVFGPEDLVSGRQHISYFRSGTVRIKSLRTGTVARNSRVNSPTSKKVTPSEQGAGRLKQSLGIATAASVGCKPYGS